MDGPALSIATSTYRPGLWARRLQHQTCDLFSNVFESAGNSFPRISAQVITRVLLIPEPGTCALLITAISIALGRRARHT